MTKRLGRWRGVIGLEGVETTDGRIIDEGALTWELPIPLIEYVDENYTPKPLGAIEKIERDGQFLRAEGTLQKVPSGWGLEMGVTNADTETDWEAATDPNRQFGRLRTKAGRLRYVMVGDNPCWPEHVRIEILEVPSE